MRRTYTLPDQKTLETLQQAAKLQGLSLSAYVLHSALQNASKVLTPNSKQKEKLMAKPPLNHIAETVEKVCIEQVGKEWTYRHVTSRLADADKIETLVWMNCLDTENLQAVAKALGVSHRDLDITCRTLRSF